MPVANYWGGRVPTYDDFGFEIIDEFIDGKTRQGPWALMSPAAWALHGYGSKLGTGLGQRYKFQSDNRWLKVEG